jgi:hypothetical protein
MAKSQTIELKNIEVKNAQVFIVGDSDLILNKVNARYERELRDIDVGAKTVKEVPNMWEDIITAVKWNIPYPVKDTYNEMNEETYHYMIQHGKPCISSYGLWKSIGDAVVRNEIDTYATKIKNAVNIIATGNSIPIDFAEATVDSMVMPLKKGGHTITKLNRFTGWSCNFMIRYTENVYTLNQIINFINLAGFGLGIGSGRSSGYGRYHVVDVKGV